mmetsp:Transcript_108371/g.306444  ORF Transcript_108371/g.306444 Transcript_108371/m.306444 type:complete len:120 (+) Transcript_108371:283-642(+)
MLACFWNWAFSNPGSSPFTLATEKQNSDGDGHEVVVVVTEVIELEVELEDDDEVVVLVLVDVKVEVVFVAVVVLVVVVAVLVTGWHGACVEQRGSRSPSAPLPVLSGLVASHSSLPWNK